jgi:hypothetical protein
MCIAEISEPTDAFLTCQRLYTNTDMLILLKVCEIQQLDGLRTETSACPTVSSVYCLLILQVLILMCIIYTVIGLLTETSKCLTSWILSARRNWATSSLDDRDRKVRAALLWRPWRSSAFIYRKRNGRETMTLLLYYGQKQLHVQLLQIKLIY